MHISQLKARQHFSCYIKLTPGSISAKIKKIKFIRLRGNS